MAIKVESIGKLAAPRPARRAQARRPIQRVLSDGLVQFVRYLSAGPTELDGQVDQGWLARQGRDLGSEYLLH